MADSTSHAPEIGDLPEEPCLFNFRGAFRLCDGFFPRALCSPPREGEPSFPRRLSQYAGVRRRSRIPYSTRPARAPMWTRNISCRHSGMCSCLVRCTRMHSTQFPWRWQRTWVQGQSSTCTGSRSGTGGLFALRFMSPSADDSFPACRRSTLFSAAGGIRKSLFYIVKDSSSKNNLFRGLFRRLLYFRNVLGYNAKPCCRSRM